MSNKFHLVAYSAFIQQQQQKMQEFIKQLHTEQNKRREKMTSLVKTPKNNRTMKDKLHIIT